MASHIIGEAVMVIEWCLLGVAFAFVITRITVRLVKQQKHLLPSDIILLLSALVALGLIITDTLAFQHGAMSSDREISDPVGYSKVAFAGNYFYDTGIYFPKFSILAFYLRLFPKTTPRLRIALYVACGCTVIFALTTLFADTFWCGKVVSVNWSEEEGACNSFESVSLFNLDWAMNFVSDVFIFVLPFPLLRGLNLRKRQFYGVVFTFGLGLVTISINVARFCVITLTDGSNNSIYVWSMAEMATAIMVVCLPALRSLLRQPGDPSSSSDPSSNRIARAWNSALSNIKSSKIASVTSRNDQSRHRASRTATMERISAGDSEVELTTFKADGIYKAEEVSVQGNRIPSIAPSGRSGVSDTLGPLGTSSRAWGQTA